MSLSSVYVAACTFIKNRACTISFDEHVLIVVDLLLYINTALGEDNGEQPLYVGNRAITSFIAVALPLTVRRQCLISLLSDCVYIIMLMTPES